MAEANSGAPDPDRIGATRGKAYPAIALDRAMELVEKVREANIARAAVSPEVYYRAWGYKGESGANRPLIAALNHYGMIEYVGRGDSKQVRLSSLAHRIIFDKVPNSRDRAAALKEAALSPDIFRKLMDSLAVPVPPEYVVETFLTRDCGYNEQVAKVIYANYLATLEYAGLDKPDNMPSSEEAPEVEDGRRALQEPEIGDLVQWESDGVLRLPKPAILEAIRELNGRKWGFLSGAKTGVPMDQLIVERKGAAPPPPDTPPEIRDDEPPKPGARKEVFALDEGDVVLTFPENLSAESFADLEGYFELFLRKARRRAGLPVEPKKT
jgi:hypothetical protein